MMNYAMMPMFFKDSLITSLYGGIILVVLGVIGYLYVDNMWKQNTIDNLEAKIVEYKMIVSQERNKNEGLLANRKILDTYYDKRPDFVITGKKPDINKIFKVTPK